VNILVEFQYRLDACLFLLIIGIVLLFATVLLLGFLVHFFYADLKSAHLQTVFFASLIFLFGFICYAVYLGRVVAWANSVLKIQTGSEDQVFALGYLAARFFGSVIRKIIKL
jgi:hypothetical protein